MNADLQAQVQQAIEQMVESGAERGVQVAVYQHGKPVVEAAAGVADPDTGRAVTLGTVFYNWSIGKAATATVVHVLVERGLFGYDTPVAELWPEFAAHGKGGVTVQHALNQTAGVPGIPLDSTIEDLCDWEKMCAAVADAEPWWEAGTKIGYHAYTFGYILGEVVRRVTGRPISRVLEEEVAGPLGVSGELYFGMPASEHGRLARLEDAPMPEGQAPEAEAFGEMPADLPLFRSAPMHAFPTAALGNRTDMLEADIPAGGKTSARAMARLYAALLDEVDGVRLISPERLAEVTAPSASGPDQVFGMPTTWGLGYSVGFPMDPELDSPTLFGVGGVGGSFACGDTATGIAFALTKNRLTNDMNAVGQVLPLVIKALS
ncbi:serine hydrolase domain-containing protein [Actinomadura miaoliensis]|uniref:Serine hydrolase domain-containing protein n=1 Tax=Actinomadura miaoliensis TaxID=430685 RepID=A0ABP7WG84_9ACTN